VHGNHAAAFLDACVSLLREARSLSLALSARIETVAYCFAQNAALGWAFDHGYSSLSRRLSVAKDLEAVETTVDGEWRLLSTSSIACRYLIEVCAACPPQGTKPPHGEQYDCLLALAHLVVEYGARGDAYRLKLSPLEVSYDDRSSVSCETLAYTEALRKSSRERATARCVLWSTVPTSNLHYSPQLQVTQDKLDREYDLAFEMRFGFTPKEHATILGEIRNVGDALEGPAKVMNMDTLRAHLTLTAGFRASAVTHFFDEMGLAERPEDLGPAAPSRAAGVDPWRFARERSFLRRPLVLLGQAPSRLVMWGNLNLMHGMLCFCEECTEQRYRFQGTPLEAAIGRMVNAAGKEFMMEVKAEVLKRPHLRAPHGLRRFSRVPMADDSGHFLGDIDVLAVNESCKRIALIECKRFSSAAAPHEVRRELDELNKTLSKQEARTRWLLAHQDLVAAELGLESVDSWDIQALVVTSDPTVAAYLVKSSIPIMSFLTFANAWLPTWAE
jgi:hypothetical protein